MKYPKAGDLQKELGTTLSANPQENPFEVHSGSGFEQSFGNQDDAESFADELRRAGAHSVRVKKPTKLRPPRPRGAPPMYHAPQGRPPGVPNPSTFTAKGERMYEHIKEGIEKRGGARSKEIAARTVYARAKEGVEGLVKNPSGRSFKEGMRVIFQPSPVSFAMYTSPPPAGATGVVVSVPLPGGRRTYLPGPGGGLVYVDWDLYPTMGVSPNDLKIDRVLERAKKVARGNPESTFDSDILAGSEQAIWVTSYADYVKELPDKERKALGPGPGGNWEDVVPPAPANALLAAEDLYTLIERANGKTPGQLLELAAHADNARATEDYAELFGHYLAMQSMGHGVSWFDDHAEFPVKFPRGFEAHFDGDDVWWSPQVRSKR